MSATEPLDPTMAPRSHRLTIDVRMKDDTVRTDLKPEEVFLLKREAISPWRPPSMFKNQGNLPGYFWMSQTKQMVMYESRLEMTALKFIDFEEAVEYVIPQPFCLRFDVLEVRRFHIPDFLIYRRTGRPLLLNVKPKRFLEVPRNKDAFGACNSLSRKIAIEHRIASEPDAVELANVRWLAGYRVRPLMFGEYQGPLRERLGGGRRVGFESWIEGIGDDALVRPVAFHLMWQRFVDFDSHRLLDHTTDVWISN